MTRVGGDEPKATLSLAQAQEAPEAVPPDEPPSLPLTPADRLSIQEDLDDARWRLELDIDRVCVSGRERERAKWLEMRKAEIARLERMLEEDA